MGLFYIYVGIDHFVHTGWYERIIPPFLPFKTSLVFISGVFEVILGFSLFIPNKRYLAGWGLIILLIMVYPANIYLAWTDGRALNVSPLIAWGRLPLQLVFIGLAYWHSQESK